ncbi:MAG: VWA domain-containing protein, partial [Bacteroidales bacterium]|nr:VWA domain-containing protein [Bacteroidales bacterium]
MFRFENEYMFYGLGVVAVFLFLYIYIRWRQKKALFAFGEKQLIAGLMPEYSGRMKTFKFIIICFIYICLVFALANPQIGAGMEKGKRKGIDIMYCLDVSNSMLAQDYTPNRLESAKRALLLSIDKLKGDRIGLVVFAGKSYVQLPITSDYAAAKTFISNVDTRSISEQGTDIAAAIDMAAVSMLAPKSSTTASQNPTVNKVIVVISDGEDHATDAVEMAKEASKQGIKIYTIGIGNVEGEPIPVKTYGGEKQYKKDQDGNTVITRLNEEILKEVADAGNGKYVYASNAIVGFEILNKELEMIEKAEIEDVVFKKYNSKYYIPLWIAFFLIVLDVLLYNKKIIRLSHFSWLNKNMMGVLFLFLFSIHNLMGQS